MDAVTISAVAMAATVFVLGAWHLLLWSRRRDLSVHLAFGLTCVSVGVYDVTSAGLYHAESVTEGVGWQSLQSVGMAAGAACFTWFVFSYTASKSRTVPIFVTLAHVPIVAALALGQRQWVWTDVPAIKQLWVPLAGTVTYYEAAPGILAHYQTLLGIVVFGYALVASSRMVGRGDRKRGTPLLVATALFFAGAANDTAVELGLYSFPYVLEVSFLGLALLMTSAISNEVLRAHTLSAALVASEERYRQLVEGTEDFVVRVSLDGRLLFVNRSLARVLGVTPTECLGRDCLDYIQEEDRGRALAVVQAAMEDKGRHTTLETRIAGEGGRVRDVLWTLHFQLQSSGRVAALNAIGRDITRRKVMEKALRESEQAYQALVERSLQAVAVFEGPRYVFVNSRMTEIFGWSREEFLAMTDEQAISIIHPQDREMVLERRLARQAGRTAPSIYEFRIVRKDHQVRWVQVFANAIEYRGRSCSLAVYIDITPRREAEEARHQAEAERAALEAQLRHAQKMEAVGLLAGGVAHDFNNLLQAIVGHTQLASRSADTSSPARRHLDQVLAASDRAAALTRQLLAFSRAEEMQPRVVRMNDLISDLMKMLGRVLGEQVELSFRTRSDVGAALVDFGQVEQVLINLCINARDAMPDGGRIEIESSRQRADESFRASHPWAQACDYVVIAVRDWGAGIPPEILDRIFEPFFTTKEVGRGTGLGLATVYAIVQRHGGGVTVESTVGRGSCFRVYLPASDSVPSDQAVACPAELPQGGSEVILVAEDDEMVRSLATTVLKDAGYRLIVAQDGDQAIRLVADHAREIDLALIDMVMPGRGGLEVRDAIRSLQKHIPILFSTGYSPGVVRGRGTSLQGEPVLLKPYEPSQLLRTVRKLLDDSAVKA